MEKFGVYCRYEYFARDGISFTKWFKTEGVYDTEQEAKEHMKEQISDVKSLSKKIKRAYEFEVRKFDYKPYVYIAPEKKEPKKRGRKPKNKVEE